MKRSIKWGLRYTDFIGILFLFCSTEITSCFYSHTRIFFAKILEPTVAKQSESLPTPVFSSKCRQRTQRWGRSFMWTLQEVKEEETKCLEFDLLLPGLNLRTVLFFFFHSSLLSACPFEDRCFRRPAGGLMLLFGLMGQENEHFLRFNPPHNCWKETKLSAVNSGAPLCRAGPLVCSSVEPFRTAVHLQTHSSWPSGEGGGGEGLKRPNSFFFLHVCLAGRFAPLMAPKGRGGGRDVSCVGSLRGLTHCPWW